jgi:diacylglycerol kinase family enzyme
VANIPEVDAASPLCFVINAASGRNDPDATRQVIEETLHANGRAGELLYAKPGELANVARKGAAKAQARRSAVVAVGGDGTINAVAQAAYIENCPMGVVPQGTFNYFARTHGIPTDVAGAMQALMHSAPVAVQVGLINDQVFLVNASVGLYPELLQDREAYKARFGRSRLVAFGAALATLLARHRQLQLRIERSAGAREVKTPTLFVGNNRLQLEQVGLPEAQALDEGCIAAVMLRPIGSLAMLWLLFRGAFGSLGEADTVESFKFHRMLVTPRPARYGRKVKVAFDGELSHMRAPLDFRVAPRPLFLLKSDVIPPEQGRE